MAKDNIARDKSKNFALRIVRLYQYLINDKKEFVLSKQILRSGTSIGANLAESVCAMSEKDLNKIIVCHFKPDYAIDTLLANNYICHFLLRVIFYRILGFFLVLLLRFFLL